MEWACCCLFDLCGNYPPHLLLTRPSGVLYLNSSFFSWMAHCVSTWACGEFEGRDSVRAQHVIAFISWKIISSCSVGEEFAPRRILLFYIFAPLQLKSIPGFGIQHWWFSVPPFLPTRLFNQRAFGGAERANTIPRGMHHASSQGSRCLGSQEMNLYRWNWHVVAVAAAVTLNLFRGIIKMNVCNGWLEVVRIWFHRNSNALTMCQARDMRVLPPPPVHYYYYCLSFTSHACISRPLPDLSLPPLRSTFLLSPKGRIFFTPRVML